MKLRNQLLTLSLVTLLVPWAGWKLVQELEAFLRSGQENALLATAHTVAQALPADRQRELAERSPQILHLRGAANDISVFAPKTAWVNPTVRW